MGNKTTISWTEATINAWIGCVKISKECERCYAETQEKRYKRAVWGKDKPRYKTKTSEKAAYKLNRKALKKGVRIRVFMSSLSDFFEDNPQVAPWRARWWKIVKECRNIDWLILTKRGNKVQSMLPEDFYSGAYKHVHLGVSVGMKSSIFRLDDLRAVPDWGGIRFVSAEPLLESLGAIDLTGFKWVIVGGESTVGNSFRPMLETWVQDIKDQCEAQGATFFFKQDAARQGCHSDEFRGKRYLELPMFQG